MPNFDSARGGSYFEQNFTVERVLGHGYFGTVVCAKSNADGRSYAVKIANEKYTSNGDRARKLEEVRKHQFLLPHPNCVHFYTSWEENGRLYQQFELCRSSLADLAENWHDLPEKLIWSYLIDLLLAVKHLHDHDLVHMDIKPENIFVGMDGVCKLGDFGLVMDLSLDRHQHLVGDAKYLAPEALDESKSATKACDVFSLGMTILELATDLDLPTSGELWHQLRSPNGIDPTLTARLSPDLLRLIQLMMFREPERRPTVDQLLQIQAVKKARNERSWELFMRRWIELFRSIFAPILFFWTFMSGYCNKLWLKIRPPKTPPQNRHRARDHQLNQAAGNAFSSDEEDRESSHFGDHSEGDTSSLASPLPPSSDSKGEQAKFAIPSFTSSPISPRFLQPRPRRVQSTPSGMPRHRSHAARMKPTPPPQKRLSFNHLPEDDEEEDSFGDRDNDNERATAVNTSSKIDNDEDDDDDETSSSYIKPVCLADKFDCFSDSDFE